jgi:hypothetical protein
MEFHFWSAGSIVVPADHGVRQYGHTPARWYPHETRKSELESSAGAGGESGFCRVTGNSSLIL